MNYEETMQYGESQYRDVIDALRERGLIFSFTQTGGMTAALEAVLDGGASLLITDVEDGLSWERRWHEGRGDGLYGEIEDRGERLACASSDDGDVETLLGLVDEVLQGGRGSRPSYPRIRHGCGQSPRCAMTVWHIGNRSLRQYRTSRDEADCWPAELLQARRGTAKDNPEGKCSREIRRCRKRYITRELYRTLTAAMTLAQPPTAV
jgi:hypothetical protein